MITVEEALKRILESMPVLGLEKTDILSALGSVLGEDIYADRNIPPHDNSGMDGYAVRFQDTSGASRENPAVLKVIEDLPAGRVAKNKVLSGEAIRIMTGAPIPEGADAVTRVEDTEKDGDRVKIFVPAKKGLDIRFAGEDVRKDELVIPRGTLIRAPETGMLASLGRSFVHVHQKPVVAILSTGDELVDIDEALKPGKIVNSNTYSMAAQVLECGATPMLIGIARDTREDLTAKFRMASRADLIISSGGVSVGDYDLVKDIMSELGNAIQFWSVAMRPGRPLAFGAIGGKPLFGLPGNPVSTMISFEQFIRPAILKMRGFTNLFRRSVKAVMMEDYSKKGGLKYFIRGRIEIREGRYYVTTTGEQGSGILKSMVKATGLIMLPEDVTFVKAGDEVKVQLLSNFLDLSPAPEHL
jgi:molybdopterin molybdotransferase